METGHSLLVALDAASGQLDQASAASTGFVRLDDLTGGLRAGQVWIVTGARGQGRSTLLTQWAAHLALTQHWATWVSSPREPASTVAARLIATHARVPVLDVLAGDLGTEDRRRADAREPCWSRLRSR